MRLIILLILAGIFGYGILQINEIDPDNYVKMYLGNYVVEVKVLGFVLLLIALVALLYFLLGLIRLIWRSPKLFSKWREQKNHDAAEQKLGAGYLSLIKGDWRRAEQQLISKSKHSRVPYVNYLAAAQAVQQLGNIEKRDQYLLAAYEAAPKERLAIGLTKAKLHQQAGQLDEALETLNDIQQQGADNPQFTAMLLQTCQQKQQWQEVKALLPKAMKQKALPKEMLTYLHGEVAQHALATAENPDDVWRKLGSDEKKHAPTVLVYCKSLLRKGDNAAAEKIIRGSLKRIWSDDLVALYGKLSMPKPAKLLRQLEGWMMARPENAQLQLAAGRMAKQAGDNDKAIEYLQKAIGLQQLPEAYAVLAEIYEANNHNGKALQLYRTGMQSLSDASLKDSVALSGAGDDSLADEKS